MSAKILDGRLVRDSLLPRLVARVGQLSQVPTLAIIQVGSRSDSTTFIKAKINFAKKIDVTERYVQLSEATTQQELMDSIAVCNQDSSVQGIILQLPLPQHLHSQLALESIAPNKDVDRLTSVSVKKWLEDEKESLLPATARGILELLNHYDISLRNKHVVVVGKSALVGRPIAVMCEHQGAVVTVCDSKTVDLDKETNRADVLIVAVGRPGLIGAKHVRSGAVVIDVGINRALDGKLVGDVDINAVKELASSITPVPGGVGPMTVLAIFENLVDLASVEDDPIKS